jgi:hypothetical protein
MSNINDIRYEYVSPLAWANDLERPGTKANNRLMALVADIESDTESAPLGYRSSADMWKAKDKAAAKLAAFKAKYQPDTRYPAWYDPTAKSQDNAEPILAAAYALLVAMATHLVALKNTQASVRNLPRSSPAGARASTPARPAAGTPAPASSSANENPAVLAPERQGFGWWWLVAAAAAYLVFRKDR